MLCLAGVSVLYVLLALAVDLRTRAWENNDEDSHVEYAAYVMEHHALPPINSDYGDEVHQGPLYYVGLAVWQKLVHIPHFRPDWQFAPVPPPGEPQDVPYKVKHDYSPTQAQQARWLKVMRLFSIGLGLVTVVAVFAVALQVTGVLSMATAVAATVAVWPKFLVVTAAISNDPLVDAACAVALATLIAWIRSDRWPWALATGVALGVAALAKETALPVAIAMLAVLGLAAWHRRRWGAPLLVPAVMVAMAGWWYVRNRVLYGDFLATAATNRYFNAFLPGVIRPQPSIAAIPASTTTLLPNSVWYDGGWNQLMLPRWWAVALSLFALVCIGAALLPGRRRILPMNLQILAVVAAAIASLLSWAALVRDTTIGEGRYLFVAIGSFALLLVVGTVRLLPTHRLLRWAALAVWPLLLLAADGYVLVRWMVPYGGI